MEQISEHCWVTSSRFCRTNTVVVAGPSGALVIDPGVHGDELVALAAQLSGRFGGCALAISTHPHWDHLLWATDLGAAPRLASAQACEIVSYPEQLVALRAEAAAEVDDCEFSLLGQVTPVSERAVRSQSGSANEGTDEPAAGAGVLGRGEELWRLDWDGPEVEFVVHQGHAPGHLGLRVPGDGVLIAGDMCSDDEVPLLDLTGKNPLDDYWDGLSKLAWLAASSELLVPGHGGVARGAGEISERFERDQEYLQAMAAGRVPDDARLKGPGREWMLVEHEAMTKWCLRSRLV